MWIANRARPISNPGSSQLTISQDGNMALLDRLQSTIWVTNVIDNISIANTVGVILDTGNFVVVPSSNTTNFLWQSFNEPTNVWLPGAKFGRNKVIGHSIRMVSWDSSIDPSPGYYTLLIDQMAATNLSTNGTTLRSIGQRVTGLAVCLLECLRWRRTLKPY